MRRRVVITGLGTVNPCGLDAQESWKRVLAGESGIARITRFDAVGMEMPCLIAGELKGFEPTDFVQARNIKKLDLSVLYGIAAADKAWADAGFLGDHAAPFDAERAGAIIGTGIGGLDSIEQTHTKIMDKGPQRVSAFFVPRMMPNAIAGNVSIRFGLQGPSYITASACASSNHAMAAALRSIRLDEQDICVTGGCEATITSMGMAGFNAMRAMSRRNDDPKTASRPFDKNRDGFVMGEGAGMLVFEEYEHAKKRGARIYCEVLGAGMSADAHHITAPAPGGRGPMRAMQLALKDAQLNPTDIDYVNAHGTSTALNDAAETAAVKSVFGDHAKKLCMSSSKSMVGHLLGGSGGVEALFTALSIHESKVHPTINQIESDPECDLDYIANEGRDLKIKYAVSNSLGFGGHNVTVAFGAV